MPAPYDYSSATGYGRARPDWADFPSTTTPIQQSHLDKIEQALFDKKNEIFNVGDYGVLPANSAATNDTNFGSLLSAVTAGGVIQFNIGDYAFSTAKTLPRVSQKGIVVRGMGARATKITYTGSNYLFNVGGGSVADYAQHQGITDLFIDLSGSATPTGAFRFNSGFYNYLERVSILGPTGGTKILVYFDPGDGSYGNYHNRIVHCVLQGQTSASDIGIKLYSTNANGANSNFVRDNWFGVFLNSVLIDGGDGNDISGNEFNGTTSVGVKLTSANTNYNKIIANKFDGPTTAVDIAASVAETVVRDNTTASSVYANAGTRTRETNNNGAWSGAGTFIDYEPGTSITAAATLPLLSTPSDRKVMRVDGTANITAISGGRNGQIVTLLFTGTASGTGLTDGSNLKLAGNFVYTPNDTITLLYDGTDWYELCRSVN